MADDQQNGQTSVVPANEVDSRRAAREQRKRNLAKLPLFVTENEQKLAIKDDDGVDTGFWIIVKEELDFGEQSILDNASIRGVQREQLTEFSEAGQTLIVDLSKQRFLTLALYILEWNLTDALGREIKIPRPLDERIKLYKRLSPAWGDALVDTITRFIEERNETVLRVEKNLEESSNVAPRGDGEAPPKTPVPTSSSNGGVLDGQIVEQRSSPIPAGPSAN